MFWTILFANFVTLFILFGLLCVLLHNKDKIRKWLYHKKSEKKKGVK